MANMMRWRYGDTQPVMLPVDSATVIEIGDLVYLDTDDAKPAGSQADAGTEAANQEAFHDKFAGVALQRSRAGDTAPVRVATRGVFEFDCPSTACEVGALFGASENSGGTALLNQQIETVATVNLAVGRCVQRNSPAGTKALIEIVSTVVHGGPQPVA
ncbi:MAG: hypothetical protein SFX18_01690 [Pirellulales bacterium]|nr:hypothetical protein [Pirellulales bacterium]